MILRDLLGSGPKKPHKVAMKDLFQTLQKHFELPLNDISKQFRFHQRSQGSVESVTEYLVELHRLASKCKFGDYRDQMLRDQFVCGLHSGGIQKSLLAVHDDLPLKKALDLALAYEAVDKSVKDMQVGHSGQEVPHVHVSWFGVIPKNHQPN